MVSPLTTRSAVSAQVFESSTQVRADAASQLKAITVPKEAQKAAARKAERAAYDQKQARKRAILKALREQQADTEG